MFRLPLLLAAVGCVGVAECRGTVSGNLTKTDDKLNGSYEGSVPLIIDIKVDFNGGSTANFDLNVKVAKMHFVCPTETIAETDTLVTFPNSKNTGDCLGDHVRSDKGKDPSKYTIIKNSDGTLTFTSDGYPNMKMKKKN